MTRKLQCPKCGKAMEEGTVIDRSYGRTEISSWLKGQPEMGWFGVKLGGLRSGAIKLYPITSYCCSSCGYLESYVEEGKS